MPQRNVIDVHIPETDLAEIKAALGTLKAKLLPQLQTLTAKERVEIPKMGDKTAAFVQKAFEYAGENKELVPTFLDMSAMASDLTAVQELREINRVYASIGAALEDSITLAGSEAYQAALVFYNNIKSAAKSKAPGAAAIYDDLSARFPGYTDKKKT